MKSTQSRYLLMLVAIVAVGLLVLVANLVLLQQQNKRIKTLEAQTKQQKIVFRENQDKMANKAEDERSRNKLRVRLATLDQHLADYQYMPTYLKEMKLTAGLTKNKLRVIQPGDLRPLDWVTSPLTSGLTAPEQAGEGAPAEGEAPAAPPAATPPEGDSLLAGKYRVMPINLDITGDYVSLINLLDQFRQFRKMIYVRTVEIAPVSQLDGKNDLAIRMQTYAIITADQYARKAPKVMPVMEVVE